MRFPVILWAVLFSGTICSVTAQAADPPKKLTLADAEAAAIRSQTEPGIGACRAAGVDRDRSRDQIAFLPSVTGNFTGVGADRRSRRSQRVM